MTNAVSLAQQASTGVSQGFKNRIINGAMVIDQRNAGASITPTNGQYSVDRWACFLSQASKYSVQQNAGSVTPPVGFKNYLGVTSLSAYSVLSSDYFFIYQPIEGLNTYDLDWGTANAKTVTLSFWVRSSLTGTFGGALRNDAANRSYPFSYTISAANTWEQKSVTIAGDTSGTWLTTNAVGIYVQFNLGAGATFSGTANAWSAGNLFAPTGATSVVGTNGATFYITGVQLEVGSTATSFDYRPYTTELQLCQRYFYKTNPENTQYTGGGLAGTVYSNTTGVLTNNNPVYMRAAPTLTRGGTYDNFYIAGVNAAATGTINTANGFPNYVWTEIASLSAGANGYQITYNGQLSVSAEL